MRKFSVICQSVFLFVTFFEIQSFAQGEFCKKLFSTVTEVETTISFEKNALLKAEDVMNILKQNVLSEIRTSNPTADHIEFFSAQVPLIQRKLLILMSEAISTLSREKPRFALLRDRELFAKKSKKLLIENLQKSYDLMVLDGTQKLQDRTVTYEWYMSHILKTIIFFDVTARAMDSGSKESYEVLNRKLDTLMGRTKAFYSANITEILVYSTLSKEFSSISRGQYFARHIPENPIIPVLFMPRDADVIEAESMGFHFLSVSASRKDTHEGKMFPLELAGQHIRQATKQIQSFRDYQNPKSKWLKYHRKISTYIKGDAALESLYAYVIKDAGLQVDLSVRLETGYRVAGIAVNSNQASQYLRNYFSAHRSEINQIASERTVDAFLKVISQIEKEGLASHYRN